MLQVSPVKIVAGIVAVVLAMIVLFYGSQMRQGVVDLLSVKRPRPAGATQPVATQADSASRPSTIQVIPFGVAPKASEAKR